ncbi:MAG: nucleotidyl transferase AbiEii/AbiGii toxin family protein [Polyangiaceae bacterium]
MPHAPRQVIPPPLAAALASVEGWFVIGGHAVRCFVPYRPSRDVDLGVMTQEGLTTLVDALRARGNVEIVETGSDTVHLRFDGLNVSVFVLPELAALVEGDRLSVTGILATKLHAILARGTRRDFFDLYVTLQHHRLGIAECLAAMHGVYGADVSDELLLRALTYFDDAEREALLPGEGPDDWKHVRRFFLERVGNLLVPPSTVLAIQERRVDVSEE